MTQAFPLIVIALFTKSASRPLQQTHQISSIDVILLIFSASPSLVTRTLTPRPAFALSSPTTSGGSLALLWWRPHKGELNRDGLIEQFRSIRALNCRMSFGDSRVFDKYVSLEQRSLSSKLLG